MPKAGLIPVCYSELSADLGAAARTASRSIETRVAGAVAITCCGNNVSEYLATRRRDYRVSYRTMSCPSPVARTSACWWRRTTRTGALSVLDHCTRVPGEPLVVLTVPVMLAVAVSSSILYGFPEHIERYLVSGGLCVIALFSGVSGMFLVLRYPRRARVLTVPFLGMLLLICTAIVSVPFWPRVQYARPGLTVVGLLPLPGFDFVVTSGGSFRLRPKSHLLIARG